MMQFGKAEPIGTLPHWKRLGRFIKKGEKAITLLMPVTRKERDEGTGEDALKMFFIGKPRWFGLSQTNGAEYVSEPLPDFDLDRALDKLNIILKPFELVDGNTQGYAIPNMRTIAISPIAFDPPRTTIHETGHVLLHATECQMIDGATIGRVVREVEAEMVAYLVKASLGIDKGQEYSRGYLQNW